jgi:nicotinate-nucleotide adenylyltransferase
VKTGLFGGTFDPVHNGHISSALSVLREFSLDRIIFIPSKIPVHKRNAAASPDDRCAMLEIAVRKYPFFVLSRIEIDRSAPSYSVITADEMAGTYPGDEFYFIIGTDAFNGLNSWREPERLMRMVRFIVMARDGVPADPVLVEKCGAIIAANPRIDISSSVIRERLKGSGNAEEYMDADVLRFIKDKGLYKGELVQA